MTTRDRVMFGSHNVDSVNLIKKNITERFPEQKIYQFYSIFIYSRIIPEKKEAIFIAQLHGFSDNLTYSLREEGFAVKKYVPYGPYNQSMPYLIRRGQESR